MVIVLTKNSLSKVIFILTVISVSEQQLELYITHHFAFLLWGSKFHAVYLLVYNTMLLLI